MSSALRSVFPAPARTRRRTLRVLGTEITLLERLRQKAMADLGFDIAFELLDFVSCQRRAAMEPQAYDIYDQCFWFRGSLQPIDTQRIGEWSRLSELTREGGINRHAWRGHGDAPVRKLHVRPGESLGPQAGAPCQHAASVEEAAWSLGVSPMRTFRKVTFPLIFPGVLSAMLFAFTLSYDEFSRTLYASGRDQTLPLAIYGTFSVEIRPNVFAFGVLTTVFSFALLAVYALLMGLSVRRARKVAMQEDIT
ncbi:MAG: ABC transporter permease [Parvibaculaceae bacterium]